MIVLDKLFGCMTTTPRESMTGACGRPSVLCRLWSPLQRVFAAADHFSHHPSMYELDRLAAPPQVQFWVLFSVSGCCISGGFRLPVLHHYDGWTCPLFNYESLPAFWLQYSIEVSSSSWLTDNPVFSLGPGKGCQTRVNYLTGRWALS